MPRWTPDGIKPIFRKSLAGLTTYSFGASDGLDTTNFSSYFIELTDVLPSVDLDLAVRLSGNTGANYNGVIKYGRTNNTAGAFDAGSTSIQLTSSTIKASGLGLSGFMDVMVGTGSGYPRVFFRSFQQDNSVYTYNESGGMLKVTGLITSIDFLLSGAGTFVGGSLSFYGRRRIS